MCCRQRSSFIFIGSREEVYFIIIIIIHWQRLWRPSWWASQNQWTKLSLVDTERLQTKFSSGRPSNLWAVGGTVSDLNMQILIEAIKRHFTKSVPSHRSRHPGFGHIWPDVFDWEKLDIAYGNVLKYSFIALTDLEIRELSALVVIYVGRPEHSNKLSFPNSLHFYWWATDDKPWAHLIRRATKPVFVPLRTVKI